MRIKRKKVAILIAIACLSLILTTTYLINANNIAKSEPKQQSELVDSPSGSLLVVPESPIGTLGAIGIIAAAFIVFATIKRRK